MSGFEVNDCCGLINFGFQQRPFLKRENVLLNIYYSNATYWSNAKLNSEQIILQ